GAVAGPVRLADDLVFSITGGNPDGAFGIEKNGSIVLEKPAALDASKQSRVELEVSAELKGRTEPLNTSVPIEVLPFNPKYGLLAHWSMEGTDRKKLIDRSGRGHDAVAYFVNRTKGVVGQRGIYFGNRSYVDASAFRPKETSKLTFTGWVRPTVFGRNKPIFYTANGGKPFGLHFGPTASGKLHYSWSDNKKTWEWEGGPALSPGGWSFVALVIEPNRAVIYVGDRRGFERAEHKVDHPPLEWVGLEIGRRPGEGKPIHFLGLMDEFRFYRHALEPLEIKRLFEEGQVR
ncbi:MAG: LamG-like jellyroll fold domain-containing protein, partial [Phycisphaeraceae bacterium]|nr:LamG-like jellyroll fold domain-containing protein [Phycisphaeraceae bacterium]